MNANTPTRLSRSARRRCRLLVFLAFATTSLALAAEPAGAPPTFAVNEQKAAMARLAYMAGEWQGRGWILLPHGRAEFHGGERVQVKLDGVVLLVEGSFFHREASTGEDVPSHTTLGVISYDPRTQVYRFRSWLASGAGGEHPLTLRADGWSWEIATPGMRIRYVSRFTGDTWFETGERSADGETWHKFFEMTLERQAPH